MSLSVLRAAAAATCAAIVLTSAIGLASAQGSDQPGPDQGKNQAGDAAKQETKTRADRAAQAGQALKGPAANPECVWLGERVVNLLWRDDLDTAFRHLDLYDRFGCPGGHVQNTFRCVVRQGNIDPKATETLNARVHSCWLDPELAPPAPPPGAAPPAAPAPAPQQPPQSNTR